MRELGQLAKQEEFRTFTYLKMGKNNV